MTRESLRQLSDRELLEVTARAAADERRSTVELVELLAEVDARRLYLGEGCSSLFTYCTEILHLSEHGAFHRIEAARAMRLFPVIAERLRDGSLTLTTVSLLRPHLSLRNHAQLLAAARHRSKREVEHQIACLAPKPEVAALVRRLPESPGASGHIETPRPPQTSTGALPPRTSVELESLTPATPVVRTTQPKVEPLTSDRYLLRVVLSAAAHANLRRAEALMGHSLPIGDVAAVVERALDVLVTQLERQKIASTSRPRTSATPRAAATGSASRYLPAAVRRAVWKRDRGRCAFVGPRGRCTETRRLEFHHVVPFARGGAATTSNIALRCRAHNAYEGERCFGRREAKEH